MKKSFKENIKLLPALPSTIIELNNLKKQKNVTNTKIASILKKNPMIVSDIMNILNSNMFEYNGSLDNFNEAIILFDSTFIINIAIGSLILNCVKTNLFSYAVTNDDFLYSAALAANIVNNWVSKIDPQIKDELLLPAFLQELGKYLISEVIQNEKKTEIFLKELEDTKNTSQCEKHFIGYSCARITANIFKHWNFNHNVIFPIAFTDEIDKSPSSFKQKVQIMEIIKILSDIRYPLSDENIDKAIVKVKEYNFDIEDFLNSINPIKEMIIQNS